MKRRTKLPPLDPNTAFGRYVLAMLLRWGIIEPPARRVRRKKRVKPS